MVTVLPLGVEYTERERLREKKEKIRIEFHKDLSQGPLVTVEFKLILLFPSNLYVYVCRRFWYVFTVLRRCIIPCIPIVCVLHHLHRPAGTLNNYLLGSQTSVTVTRGHPHPPPTQCYPECGFPLKFPLKINVVTLFEGIVTCFIKYRNANLTFLHF
jgi:hypothetical protein